MKFMLIGLKLVWREAFPTACDTHMLFGCPVSTHYPFTEISALTVGSYASFVYGILYLCLAAIPIQFSEERNWSSVNGNLPFLAILLGTALAGCVNILNNGFYVRRFEANGNRAVPEARLPPMMIGSVFFASGLLCVDSPYQYLASGWHMALKPLTDFL
jgi:hypothetical protein